MAALKRGIDFGGRDPQTPRIELEPVELAGRLEQRRVASRSDIVDDGARGGLDVGRNLALDRKKRVEALLEIVAAAIQTYGHDGLRSLRSKLIAHGAA